MKNRFFKTIVFILILFPTLPIFYQLVSADNDKVMISFKEINEMEVIADKGRQHYWKGEYHDAIKIFKNLSIYEHPSLTLYINELGNSYLALGDYANAERCFIKSYKLIETYVDHKREEKALSKFGKEEEKIYRGDPYEQATSLLLLSLLLLDKGDYDNALAALKTATLSDSDATENLYDSDYTLLNLLQAKIHLLRGDRDNFIKHREMAVENYRVTHPDVRSIFAERLDKIALLKTSPDKRKKDGAKATDSELKTQLFELDKKIKHLSEAIDAKASLNAMYDGEYNTLIIIPTGRAPIKVRKGKDAQVVIFEGVNVDVPTPKIFIDGKNLNSTPITNVADIEFQATTRGGRRMDAILKGKVAFRDTSVSIGKVLTESGGQVGGYAGITMQVIGLIAQGAGGAVTPEADIRCWKTLPKSYELYALNLPEGEHKIHFEQHLYFEARNKIEKSINIKNKDSIVVIFGIPSLAGMYSSQCEQEMKLSKKDLVDREKTEKGLIITPPLGLNKIERFDSKITKDIEACSPDVKRMMQEVREFLKKRGVPAYFVTHREILNRKDEFSSRSQIAFQVVLSGLETETNSRERIYRASFDMALVNTSTGEKIFSKSITGTNTYLLNHSEPTKGFYGCLESALSQFVSEQQFIQSINL